MERKWAYFKKQEYEEFLAHFPGAEVALASSMEEDDDIIRVDVDTVGREQEVELDEEALHEMRKHIHKWYVIHTYSGYEKVVKDNLEQRLRSLGLAARVSEVLIPTEDVIDLIFEELHKKHT